jgi:large subunit ribosomal protein L23
MKLTPHISEKSFSGSEKGIYTFKVPRSAPKLEIKREVESAYGVSVVRVATATMPGKTVRRGRFVGRRPGFKKAVVHLKKGEKIAELEA